MAGLLPRPQDQADPLRRHQATSLRTRTRHGMNEYLDVMVDIETTGTHPEHNGIIQIAAVRFNAVEMTVDAGDMFDRCLMVAPNRFWEESTRVFWQGKNLKVYQQIVSRMEDPAVVLKAFQEWANKGRAPSSAPLRFWGKPTSFDYSFIQSYFRQFALHLPFHYRYGRDMNSYIAGLRGDPDHPEINVPFSGDVHNALHDVLHQIKTIFVAKEETKCSA
ncbi:MAG: hypothetical protein EOR84_22775 [Mesorhizobium sp.]|nr:MAG: hypothetical protein EOR84_22775 [Mesorhizobium sp.]